MAQIVDIPLALAVFKAMPVCGRNELIQEMRFQELGVPLPVTLGSIERQDFRRIAIGVAVDRTVVGIRLGHR